MEQCNWRRSDKKDENGNVIRWQNCQLELGHKQGHYFPAPSKQGAYIGSSREKLELGQWEEGPKILLDYSLAQKVTSGELI